MTQQTKDQQQGVSPTTHNQQSQQQQEAEKQKHEAQELEVAGRHKNDGKNDHAGHKVNR
ncbi:MAG: hypothetical protein V4805_07135 [Pseudomonadota bacterium]